MPLINPFNQYFFLLLLLEFTGSFELIYSERDHESDINQSRRRSVKDLYPLGAPIEPSEHKPLEEPQESTWQEEVNFLFSLFALYSILESNSTRKALIIHCNKGRQARKRISQKTSRVSKEAERRSSMEKDKAR